MTRREMGTCCAVHCRDGEKTLAVYEGDVQLESFWRGFDEASRVLGLTGRQRALCAASSWPERIDALRVYVLRQRHPWEVNDHPNYTIIWTGDAPR